MSKVFSTIINQKNLVEHFSKYTLVGIANAIFTFAVYWLLLKVMKLDFRIAFTVSWLAGVFFTYVLNFVWVFKPEEKLEFKKRLWKYFVIYLASYLTNILLLHYLVSNFHYDPLLLQLIIIPLVVLINFSGIKYWALK